MANKVTTLIDINTSDQLYPRTKVEAISDANSNSLQSLLDSKQDDLTAGAGITINGTTISSKLNMDLLWTNTAPTSNFSAQTVSIDLSDYNAVIIHFNWKTDDTAIQCENMCVVGGKQMANLVYNGKTARTFEPTTNGVTFTASYYAGITSNMGTNNAYLIPTKIYGVR